MSDMAADTAIPTTMARPGMDTETTLHPSHGKIGTSQSGRMGEQLRCGTLPLLNLAVQTLIMADLAYKTPIMAA